MDASETELKTLPKLKLIKSEKIHPGVSTFAENVSQVGPDHLDSLIKEALEEIPADKVSKTPIYLMATAGVRLLPKNQQTALLQSICTYLQATTNFILPDCKAHVQVISGETEGLYGWIAANYLLGGFDRPGEHYHGKNHHTYGFLDMGGASAQIAFAPNATESEKHWDDLKLVRMRTIDGTPSEHKVFSATWLGFGANEARVRFINKLDEKYAKESNELPDPCLPKGLRTDLDGNIIDGKVSKKETILVGTGMFDECLRETYPLLGKDAPCTDEPCLLNGQHVPAIDFDVNHFIGVSEYWHTTHGVFGKKHKAYDLATYQNKVMEFCSQNWSDIEIDILGKRKTDQKKLNDAQEACFKASWLINMLYDGIGIPRVGLEGGHAPGVNETKEATDKNKSGDYTDPFKPVDKIDGIELSWTLGKMVLYAAGQVPPQGDALPVGFGTNVRSGTPKDFELAGSKPIVAHDDDDDNDLDDMLKPSHSISGLVGFIIVLLLIGFVFRKKPEWRRRAFSFAHRRRRSGSGRKPSRGFSLASKLFGRTSPSYERVMEEGDAAEFELGDYDSDQNEYSDSSDGSRASRISGRDTPRLNLERSEAQRPPLSVDRTGLAVRADSIERLHTPSLQKLNAGRRSRHGSPTRSKTPFMSPLQEG